MTDNPSPALMAAAARLAADTGPLHGCEWFILCERPATGLTPHPVLGQVPTCDKCAAFAKGD